MGIIRQQDGKVTMQWEAWVASQDRIAELESERDADRQRWNQRAEEYANALVDSEDKRIELEREVERLTPSWIPVSERLPERTTNVLISHKTKVALGYIDLSGIWSRPIHWPSVTHWKPLPPPPEQEGDSDE